MSAIAPFAPATQGGTLGLGIAVTLNTGTPTSTPGTIPVNNALFTTVMVVNASSLAAYVGMRLNASYTVTNTDLVVLSNTSRLLAFPGEGGGTVYVAALNAATLGAAANMYFTPGQGGAGT
jgi:hypothetical protein